MKRAIKLGIMAAAAAMAGCSEARSQNGGPVTDRDYQVGEFNRIELGGAYDMTVHTGPEVSVHARGGQNVLDKLEVEVKGDTLVVRPKKEGWSWGRHSNGKVELTVTLPALRAASLAGAGGIRIDQVSGDSFEGSISGAGDLRIEKVDVGSLKFDVAGAGSIYASGKSRTADYGITGAGDVVAKGLTSETASISITGAGGVTANATKTANVSIVGAGDVNLAGGAKCSVSKVGSGDVNCS